MAATTLCDNRAARDSTAADYEIEHLGLYADRRERMRRGATLVHPFGAHLVDAPVFGQRGIDDLFADLLAERLRRNRDEDFHPAIEIARHPVGGRKEEPLGPLRTEREHPLVLQEAPHDRHHPDVL